MSIQFILGRAGSGKTTYILDSIKNELIQSPKKKIILLLPEQATAMNEQYIANSQELKGSLSLQILSFQRLAWSILQEVGGITRLPVTELGKLMLLRKTIDDHEKDLILLGKGKHKAGFIDSIAQLISELKKYQISTYELDEFLQGRREQESILTTKLKEISIIYEEYSRCLAGGFLDTDDYLTLLQEKVELSEVLKETEIWIDEFHGFTPQQLEIISQLIKICPKVYISLTMDPTLPAKQQPSVFNTTVATYLQIEQLAKQNQVAVLKTISLIDNQRLQSNLPLAYLEQSFFCWNKEYYDGDVDTVRIVAAQNYRAEIEYVAQEIIHLCRDKGYRFKDLGILVRDISNYQLLLETVFDDYEIPYFVDIKQKVQHHSLIELIKAALEVIHSHWSYGAMFRYLKTDLTLLNRDEVDFLENYVLAYGIKGKKWYDSSPWEFHHQANLEEKKVDEHKWDEQINTIRTQLVTPLIRFSKKIKDGRNVSDYNRAVFGLLEDLEIPLTLKKWADSAVDEGNLEKGQEHNQIWNDVLDVLDQIVVALGEQELSVQEYINVMETGLDSIRLGLIPPSLDQITIATLDRSRTSQLKVAFVLGLNEGSFPAKPINDGILTDVERELLKEKGMLLAPTIREKLFEEEFLIYTALTRSSEQLYLLYSQADTSGKGLRPSSIIRRVKELFPQLIVQSTITDRNNEHDEIKGALVHPTKALGELGKILHELKPGEELSELWKEVYNWLASSDYKKQLTSIVEALEYRQSNENLPDHLAKILYGEPFKTSVSSLEMYYRCPFSHFLTKGLRLEERKIYKLASLDLGQFYHKSMEEFTNKIIQENKSLNLLTKQEIKQEVEEVVDNLIPKLQNKILLSTGKNQYLAKRIKLTMEKAVSIMVEHAKRGVFQLQGVEVYFGPEGKIPSLTVSLKDGTTMELVGRIDRVEHCMKNNHCYFRIIDFKSGKTGLDLLEVFYGLKLQLLTYLEVIEQYYRKIEKGEGQIPAGVLYFYFKDPIISSTKPLPLDELERKLMEEFTPQGLIVADIQMLQLSDRLFGQEEYPILPATLKKEGKKLLEDPDQLAKVECQKDLFTKSSSVVTLDEIILLKEHINHVIEHAGSNILQGDIGISPCQLKDKVSCKFCQYVSVCQFDESLRGNQYRLLASLEINNLWEQLENNRRGKEDDKMDS